MFKSVAFLFLASFCFFGLAGHASAATTNYYVDKRCGGVGYIYAGTNVVDGNYATIGLIDGTTKTYTFRTTPSVDGDVKVGASGAASITNFVNAINCSGGTPGTDYLCTSGANPAVSAVFSSPYADLTAKIAGGIGNVTLVVSANLTRSGANLTDGDGSLATCATTAHAATNHGAFNSFISPSYTTKVPSPGAGNTAVINVVAGSGPYYTTDSNQASAGYFYPTQNSGTVIWNFNDNTFSLDTNVNNGSYEWHTSSISGEYYLTGTGGTQPTRLNYNGTQTNIINPLSVIIGDSIYGDWNDDSMSLFSGSPSLKSNNYGWGNYDGIGFNTVYVKMADGLSPADSSNVSNGVWISQVGYNVRVSANLATFVFNNGIFRGSTNGIFEVASPISINNSILANAQNQCIDLTGNGATNSGINDSLLINCGHRGVSLYNTSIAANFTAYNNIFAWTHLMGLLNSTAAYTWTFKNNIGYNLLAGAFQDDNASPTLIEANNSFQLDSNSTHGGKAIGFSTTSGLGCANSLRYWATTAATDFPASAPTCSRMYATTIPVTAGDLMIPSYSKWTGYAYQVQSCSGNCTTASEPTWPTSGTVTENPGANQIVWNTVLLSRMSVDPSFSSSSNFNLLSGSTAIDAGTNASLTTDYSGNSIYGAPDIGAYEYQPPYTLTTTIPTSGSVRLYSNGKYRALTATSTSATGTFSVTPVGGSFYTASTSAYMDIAVNNWTTVNKEWVATSTTGQFNTHATSTVYTLGDLSPNAYYAFKLDGTLSPSTITDNSQCTAGICLSDSSGNLSFTYTGGYSTHTFDLVALPTLTTQDASALARTTATLNGNITSTGGANITVRGFAWGTNAALSGGDTATTTDTVGQPFSTGAYTGDVSSLTCSTTYYFRPYATNSAGDGLGSVQSFITTACPSSGGGGSSSQSGRITVTNVVVNDNGGTKTVADFPLFVSGMSIGIKPVVSGVSNTFYTAGLYQYNVTETTNPLYTFTFSGDCDSNGQITLTPDNNKFCTITNNDIAPVFATSTIPTIPTTSTTTPRTNPSGLSSVQVQAILSLLDSFGIDQATIVTVTTILTGSPNNSSTPAGIASDTFTFTRNLQLHSTGADVLALQQYLNAHGFAIASVGPGSLGHETTYFGLATYRALLNFQKARNITPASGYFGPLTRGVMK